jgi:DNA-binding NtrC family response regulator
MAPQLLIGCEQAAHAQALESGAAALGLTARSVAPGEVERFVREAGGRLLLAAVSVHRPGVAGLDIVRALSSHNAGPPVLAVAGHEDEAVAAEATVRGAADYLLMPAPPRRVLLSIANLVREALLQRELERTTRGLDGVRCFADFVAGTPEMIRAIEVAKRAAGAKLPVLIEGEPGTGHEAMARAIHALNRAGGPFVTLRVPVPAGVSVNPDAIAHEKISAIAGHGAQDFDDALARAAGGTIYLEDIAFASPMLQAKLTMFLKERQKAISSDALEQSLPRLICATSQNLIRAIKQGEFSEALFYRLNVMPVWLPPLRNRREDIPGWALRFAVNAGVELGKRIVAIDEAALAMLRRHDWPGNLRQLENAVYRAVAASTRTIVSLDDFAPLATSVQTPSAVQPLARPGRPPHEGPAMIGEGVLSLERLAVKSRHGHQLGIPALNEAGDVRPLNAIEADLIRIALGHYRGHMTEIARKLGIGRSTLYRKMREFGLDFRMH